MGFFTSKDAKATANAGNPKKNGKVVRDGRRARSISSCQDNSTESPSSSPTSPSIPNNHHIPIDTAVNADAKLDQTQQNQNEPQQQQPINQQPIKAGTTRSPIPKSNSRYSSTPRNNALRLSNELVSPGSIRDKYELEIRQESSGSSLLGRGKHSTVRLASERASGTLVAVKKYRLYQLGNSDIRSIRSEVEVLSKISNLSTGTETAATVAVVRILDCYVEDEEACVYLVLELLRGGELFDFVVDRTCLREAQAKEAIKGVASALELCHSRGIAHRDVKPENVLLVDPIPSSSRNTTELIMPASNFRLVDFGFAKDVSTATSTSNSIISGQVFGDDLMRTACGTPSYTAPEVLLSSPHRSVFATREMQRDMAVYEGYGLKADMWSLGVVAYVCLCGYLPFGEEDGSTCELFRQIVEAKVSFHSQYWRNVSDDAKDFVRKLLCPDPTQRLSAEQVLAHPWLQSAGETGANTIAA